MPKICDWSKFHEFHKYRLNSILIQILGVTI
jgi:hypothetical protein